MLVALVIDQAWFLCSAVFCTHRLECQIWPEFMHIVGNLTDWFYIKSNTQK